MDGGDRETRTDRATPPPDRVRAAEELLEIRVSGLECATCARRLALHVRACRGVKAAIANPRTGVLRVWYRPEEITDANVMVEIRRAGFVPGGEQLRLGVLGMHCRSCARAIERAVREHCPVERVCARHEAGEVLVDYLPGRSSPAAIAEAVEALGYRVESMETIPFDSG